MGAATFFCVSLGNTPDEAFAEAVRRAKYDTDAEDIGYTGTIAEKESFVVIDIPVNTMDEAKSVANGLISIRDKRIDDHWGPAGCIQVPSEKTATTSKNAYLFFGWASA